MSQAKFHSDLAVGHKGEIKVANVLKRHYVADRFSRQDADKTFDFRLFYKSGKVQTFEVKTDLRSKTTGNVYLEYSCSNKDSGLETTKAARWAILLPHRKEIFVFCPTKMKKYLAESKHKTVAGGDRKAVNGFVVPIAALLKEKFIEVVSFA